MSVNMFGAAESWALATEASRSFVILDEIASQLRPDEAYARLVARMLRAGVAAFDAPPDLFTLSILSSDVAGYRGLASYDSWYFDFSLILSELNRRTTAAGGENRDRLKALGETLRAFSAQ